jgi:uncharacterized membrane protein (DUF4010 family)
MPSLPSFAPGLALAIALGMLIGFERGWQLRDEAPGQRVAGVRTFAMLALLGGIAGLVSTGPLLWVAIVIIVGAAAALLLAHGYDMHEHPSVSATGAIAALSTILLGALAGAGAYALAAAASAALVTLLAARKPLHALLRQSSEDDVKAIVRLALVILLVLPLLPDTGLGPYQSLNPHRLWFVVVVTATIAFGGYVLKRALGERSGGLVGAAVGALVSSTAVTLSASQAIRRGGGAADQAAIALASAIMLTRAVLLVGLLAPSVFPAVARIVVPASTLALAGAVLLIRDTARSGGNAAEAPARPPGLATALIFAALTGTITMVAAWLGHALGGGSAAALIALGGMFDVDSAIAAVGALPAGALPVRLAVYAIAIPIACNTAFKAAIVVTVTGWRGAPRAVLALVLPVLAMAASAALDAS